MISKTNAMKQILQRLISRNNNNSRQITNIKYLTTIRYYHNNNSNVNDNNKWSGLINNAEKIVGYPTSFLNLRWLLNDEFANVAVCIKKLIGTNHPLLKTARNLLFQDELPCFGLIVLLVSKMGGQNLKFADIEYDKSSGILHSQRVLAEVTEMIKMSNLIHKGVLNVKDDDAKTNVNDTLYFGNKIALLTGDYLLSNAFHDLANIKNHEVNCIISTAQRDLVEAEFLGDRDCQNRPIPCRPNKDADDHDYTFYDQFEDEPYDYTRALGDAKPEWTIRTLLCGGSLLAKACSSTLKLAGHDKYVRDNGHLIGKYFALAIQARQDRDVIKNGAGEFSLISAPLMFQLKHDPCLYEEIERCSNNIDEINYDKLRKAILNGPGIEMTNALIVEIVDKAQRTLNLFEDTGARTALISITEALK